MLTIALILYGIVVVGLLGFAAKFGLGPVPAPHHAAALSADSVTLGPGLQMILRGTYLALAGAYLALAVLVAVLAYGPIRSGMPGMALAVAIAGVLTGAPPAYRLWMQHRAMNVATPWMPAAGLTVLIVVASLCALLAPMG